MPIQLFALNRKTPVLIKSIAAIIFVLVAFVGCKSKTGNNEKSTAAVKTDTVIATKPTPPQIVDTGQIYFTVSVTKNDTPLIRYAGAWPLLLMSNNFATLQLIASKDLMSVSNMLTLYMYGLPTGKVPIIPSGGKAGDVNMIMSPVINGAYDIPILPSEGFLDVTENTGKVLSGNFEARAVDDKQNKYLITGAFLNVPVNGSDHLK